MQNVRIICYRAWLYTYDIQTEKKSKSGNYPQGEILARIMNDTESLRDLMTSGTFGIFLDVFFVISCLGSFFFLNFSLGLFLVMAKGAALFFLLWSSRYMGRVFLEVRKSRGIMSRVIADLGGGFKQSYFMRHGHYATKRGEKVFDDFFIQNFAL